MGSCDGTDATATLTATGYAIALKTSNVADIIVKESKPLMIVSCISRVCKQELSPVTCFHYRGEFSGAD
jgi:hypothetical protein